MAANYRYPPWPPAKRARFMQLWRDGAPIKVIAHELDIKLDAKGRSGSILHWRKKLGLAPRRSQVTKEMSAARQIRIPDAIWAKLRSRALERGVSVSAYVRYLIRRDLGISADQDYRPMPKRVHTGD